MPTNSRRAEMRMSRNVSQNGRCSRRPLWKKQLSAVARKSDGPLGVATSGPTGRQQRRRKMLKPRRFSGLGWLEGLWKQLVMKAPARTVMEAKTLAWEEFGEAREKDFQLIYLGVLFMTARKLEQDMGR